MHVFFVVFLLLYCSYISTKSIFFLFTFAFRVLDNVSDSTQTVSTVLTHEFNYSLLSLSQQNCDSKNYGAPNRQVFQQRLLGACLEKWFVWYPLVGGHGWEAVWSSGFLLSELSTIGTVEESQSQGLCSLFLLLAAGLSGIQCVNTSESTLAPHSKSSLTELIKILVGIRLRIPICVSLTVIYKRHLASNSTNRDLLCTRV